MRNIPKSQIRREKFSYVIFLVLPPPYPEKALYKNFTSFNFTCNLFDIRGKSTNSPSVYLFINILFFYQKALRTLITKFLHMVSAGRGKPRAGIVETGSSHTGLTCQESWLWPSLMQPRDPKEGPLPQGPHRLFTCALKQVTIELNCQKVLAWKTLL